MYEYEIRSVWEQYYDFTDDRGDRHSGFTVKVLLLTYREGVIIRSEVVKCSNEYKPTPSATRYTNPLYDKFGRLAGLAIPSEQ